MRHSVGDRVFNFWKDFFPILNETFVLVISLVFGILDIHVPRIANTFSSRILPI